jgi:hypothetical protein
MEAQDIGVAKLSVKLGISPKSIKNCCPKRLKNHFSPLSELNFG